MTRRVPGLGTYTLIGKLPVPCDDMEAWSRFMQVPDGRRVAETFVGPMRISTVFLALDHDFCNHHGRALLFETMVFGVNDDEYQERCETWDEAEAMHKRAVGVATVLFDMAEVTIKAFERLWQEHKV